MCGICGIWNYSDCAPVDKEAIEKMKAVMVHRGPDDEGDYFGDSVGLGFRRLSIIDLECGNQPMSNEDDTIWLVFNGEIYNYGALRTQLEGYGHTFKTRSDTEVIIHSYEQYGIDCLDRLRGMFAFAIWDSNLRRLLLARDRLGIKPLYFSDDGSRFIFASELKAIRTFLAEAATLNYEAVERYLTFRYVPGPISMLMGVRKVQPGQCLLKTKDSMQLRIYWSPSFHPKNGLSVNELIDRTKALLSESTKLRLNADVPVGILLSGGLDSASVLAMGCLEGGIVKTAFSIGFKDAKEYDETHYAREAADHFGVRHEVILIDGWDFVDKMEDFVWYQDEPLADASSIPLFIICSKAKESVTVLLSGEGADEIFAGYNRYKIAPVLGLSQLPAFAFTKPMARYLLKHVPPGSYAYRIASAVSTSDISEKMRSVQSVTSPEFRRSLFSNGFENSSSIRFNELAADMLDGLHPLDQMQLTDIKMWLPENMLAKKDRMTMAASIEGRVPFLDHKLVEFALQLPTNLRMRALTGKWILRKAMSSVLPTSILRRKKMGWPLPIANWLRNEMRDFAGDTLLGDIFRQRGIFDSTVVRKLLKDHWDGKADNGKPIFLLLCLEIWLRLYEM